MNGGILNVLKPPGMTSHDVVGFIRRVYNIKRVGHAGTLDPAAAGVLPVAVGQATRLIEYFTAVDKSYRVELTIGYETDTGDDTGTIINEQAALMPHREAIEQALQSFVGTISQVPPMFSAIKVNGKKLYEMAREGIVVERPARVIDIKNLTLLKTTNTHILFDVACSKGTYIRSLCMDIGKRLGILAVMSFLVRTRVGQFALSDAVTLEEIEEKKYDALLPPDHYLDMSALYLSSEKATAFRHGREIECCDVVAATNIVKVYDVDHTFIGVGRKTSGDSVVTPVKVLG